MTNEIELISDGDGIAVIGEATAVEAFIMSAGLPSRELDLKRLLPSLGAAANSAKIAAEVTSNSARWVKLTNDSAKAMSGAKLMTGSSSGVARAIVTGDKGKTKHILEIVTQGPGMLANPALLAGVGGIMSQYAMQQQMDEITEYLAIIDKKVDDILRAQKDVVLADMIAVGLLVEEAITLRDHVGRVSEVTWSKVQSSTMTIARTQAYALRQLDALAEKLERESNVDELAKIAKEAERTVQEWLVVIARSIQLQDGVGVLELERVMDAAPEELESHRIGLKVAHQNRMEVISRTTGQLLQRIDATAKLKDTEVLLNPFSSRAITQGANSVGVAVVQFHERLGFEGGREELEARRWLDAAGSTRDRVIDAGAEGVGAAMKLGNDSVDRARSFGGKLAGDLAAKLSKWRTEEAEGDDANSAS